MRRFLVATNGSVAAQSAVKTGVELAAREDAEVVFVHVVDRSQVDQLPVYDQPLNVAAALAREYDVPYELELTSGFTSEAILKAADDAGAALIVVGSSGHGRVHRAVLGSVTVRLLRNARRPLLVVHPTPTIPVSAAAA